MKAKTDEGLERLRTEVLNANIEIGRRSLARFTFGNASGIDRTRGLVVIKPSGVPYEKLRANMLVVTDLAGRVVHGKLRPSSDLATHLVLYQSFAIGGIVHTHSHYATVWAQAAREIPCLGTTHADYFDGAVPVTVPLDDDEIGHEYEASTGGAIVRRFRSLDPSRMHAVLVAGHASFCWGPTVGDALETATVLEDIARMAHDTVALSVTCPPIPDALRLKHFERKHGPAAYYGQPG